MKAQTAMTRTVTKKRARAYAMAEAGHTTHEIAVELDTTPQNVRNYLRRFERDLRQGKVAQPVPAAAPAEPEPDADLAWREAVVIELYDAGTIITAREFYGAFAEYGRRCVRRSRYPASSVRHKSAVHATTDWR